MQWISSFEQELYFPCHHLIIFLAIPLRLCGKNMNHKDTKHTKDSQRTSNHNFRFTEALLLFHKIRNPEGTRQIRY